MHADDVKELIFTRVVLLCQLLDLLVCFLVFPSERLVDLSESFNLRCLLIYIGIAGFLPLIDIVGQEHLLLHLLPLLILHLLQHLFVLQLLMPFTLGFECEIVAIYPGRRCFPSTICIRTARLPTSGSLVLLGRPANNFLLHLRNKVLYVLLRLCLVF